MCLRKSKHILCLPISTRKYTRIEIQLYFEVKRYQAQMKIFGFPFFLRGGGLVWGRRGRLMRTIKAKRGVLISGARGMNGTNDISDTILVTEIK